MQIFFFKIDLAAFLLQFANGSQTVDRIAGKSADGLGKNKVDHAVEAVSVFNVCACDTFVGIDFHELPFWVIVDLHIVVVLLLVFFYGNTSVGGYPFFLQQQSQVQGKHGGNRWFDF